SLVPLERAHATMLDAVDGAIRVAPELAADRTALLDAVAGVIALLRTASADQKLQPRAWDAHDSFALDLERAAEPLYAAAAVLMPWS
ncbi:MAG: hypothetical protein JWM25_491, partial [Thermoleophilia bacterium]|nr:hypothetical protein [Thermoleophilia bacterium]